MIYVFDVSALLTVEYYVPAPEYVFGEMIDMVDDGTICFCDEVVDELAQFARGEWPFVWAKSVMNRRRHRGGGYSTKTLIGRQVQELFDPEAPYESSAPAVLAQAYDLRADGLEAYVVTEDTMEKPTRIPLAVACTRLSVPSKSVHEFLKACNLMDL